MIMLLNPRFWIGLAIALALAGSHFFAYRSGKAVVRSAWDAEKLVQMEQLAAFNAESRRIEQRRQSVIMEALNHAKIREIAASALAADLSRTTRSLRDDLATARANLPGASCSSLRQRTAVLSAVFEECSGEVEGLAGAAQGLASDLQLIKESWPK